MVIITIVTYNLLSYNTPNNIVVKYLAWTGKNVTAFYIFQWLIIGNIATAIYKTQTPAVLILWFIGITAVVSGLVWLWENRRLKKQLKTSNKHKHLPM
jgi:surface polysaccharide O-acyltransferase-like enzyme